MTERENAQLQGVRKSCATYDDRVNRADRARCRFKLLKS